MAKSTGERAFFMALGLTALFTSWLAIASSPGGSYSQPVIICPPQPNPTSSTAPSPAPSASVRPIPRPSFSPVPRPSPSTLPSPRPTPFDAETRRYCDLHRISAFTFVLMGREDTFGGNYTSDLNVNYCNLPQSKIPPAAWNALHKVTRLNAELTSALGISLEEMLPTPLTIYLERSRMGVLVSAAGKSTLYLGVFRDWPNTTTDLEFTVNEGIYLHEMGHIISHNKSKLPRFVHELRRNELFVETFADTLAMSMRDGLVSTPDSEIPACIMNFRAISESQSYRMQAGYFDNKFFMKRMNQCCLKRPGTGWDNPRVTDLCAEIVKLTKGIAGSPYDRSHLDIDATPLKGFDSHQIGIPFNSFLLELSRRLSRPLLDLYFGALKSLNADETRRSYLCLPRGLKGLSAPLNVRKFTPDQILSSIRRRLTPAEQVAFDALLERHEIGKFVVVARNRGAYEAAMDILLGRFLEGLSPEAREFFIDCERSTFAPGCTSRPECGLECIGSD